MSSASTKLHSLSTSTISRPNTTTTVSRGMPSPRTSPAMRPPTSPLSPAYSSSAAHFDSLQPPAQRPPHSRTNGNHHHLHPHSPQRQTRSLRLPSFSLPRFHPSRFPSATSSVQCTPDGNSHPSSPQPPMSPKSHQRIYSDAQKQLYFNQRDLFVPAAAGRPSSPRLAPLGSPGPVTPLELERAEGYLVAGARSLNHHSAATPSDLADQMVQAEVARQTAR